MPSPTALVGYDGSAHADRAIAAAAALFPQMEAAVAHVWYPPSPSHDLLQEVLRNAEGPTDYDALSVRLREAGAATADATAARGVALASEAGWVAHAVTRQSFNGIWFELAALAAELDARVVVVGASGHGASPLGRVADAVVRMAERPVLVVRDGSPAPAPDAPLVIGFDGSELSRAAIREAAALFPGRRAIVLHVGTLDMTDDGVELAQGEGLVAEGRTVAAPISDVVRPESAPWHQLTHVADEAGAAAIVVGVRGTGRVRRFLLGSVSSGLLHHAHRPVLVVPAVVATEGDG